MSEINIILDDFFSGFMPSLTSSLRENRLRRMELLLERLGNPERSFKSIHIAGSKGKGTVSTVLSYFLSSTGYKTGLFLSPHVYDVRERFTLASLFFKDEEYLSALNTLRNAIDDFVFPDSLGVKKPTTFELYTAYSYILFKETGCEYAVIETGLGGRLDATNTLSPIASVITQIELEHTKILGSTLREIATEKAGIIISKTPVFILDQSNEVMDVFTKKTAEKHSPLFVFNPPETDISPVFKVRKIEYMGSSLTAKTFFGDIRTLDALYSIFILAKLNLLPPSSAFDLTSPLFRLPGRFEERVIDGKTIILDGAHTPTSILKLCDLVRIIGQGKKTLIFSTAHDKDWKTMAEEIVPLFDSIIVTKTGQWKKSYPERIYSDIKSLFPEKDIKLILDYRAVLDEAFSSSDSVVATGSFYLLSELDRAIKEKGNVD